MARGYQQGYSGNVTSMFNVEGRRRKARTMISVLTESCDRPLSALSALNVGGSAGIIDEYLSRHFASVTGVDIDTEAIQFARDTYQKDQLHFEVGDAMALRFDAATFDVVVCSQVYEHVPDAAMLMAEMKITVNCPDMRKKSTQSLSACTARITPTFTLSGG